MRQLEPTGIPWPVFAVTVAVAFMVTLDLSIADEPFPSIRQAFPTTDAA